jgi:hydroxylamine dehydrogenase
MNPLVSRGTVKSYLYAILFIFLILPQRTLADREHSDKDVKTTERPLSQETKACLACHEMFTPGIVGDWLKSRHSQNTPTEAARKPELERRVSFSQLDAKLTEMVVGCYECHGRNPDTHKDNFEHFGFRINVVVSPRDCSTCHPVEEEQFKGSKKANAYGNLQNNPIYNTLYSAIIGPKSVTHSKITFQKPSDRTKQDTCFACHGMPIEVAGLKEIETKVGNIKVPALTNWPNMGVGRINPDGSKGACTACHPRHSFSIEIARKPYTCAQCHLQPDVPAWDVYAESKHGDIFFSLQSEWNFTNVPWRPGVDFRAPSCATCHNSLLVSPQGQVIANRSHDFGARLWVRIFGLPYSHPQPKAGDTSIIENKEGLRLPTTFAGEPASEYLIDKDEQVRRQAIMQSVCRNCHGSDWVGGHFSKFNSTVKETDQMIGAATKIMTEAWDEGLADRSNPFDELIEQDWIKQWLFYANSVRFASAMTGAPDYASFHYGWWEMTNNLLHMKEELETKRKLLKIQ